MNRWIAYILVVCAFALPALGIFLKGKPGIQGILYGAQEVWAPPISQVKHSTIQYGVYDPAFASGKENTFRDAKGIGIEHIFVSWLYIDPAYIEKIHQYAKDRNRWLMVTVEPSSDARSSSPEEYLDQIRTGGYDQEIEKTCKSLGHLNAPLFIRWGHEMETNQKRYPWSGQLPEKYISAYQHFVRSCRKWVVEAYYVWSPAGDPRMVHYWPTEAYVDYVGLSVYSIPTLNDPSYGHQPSFSDVFNPKYERAALYGRPVMIAELGVSGEPAYQESWMRELFRNADQYPLLKTAVYFNAKDHPGVWENLNYIPDWRISGKTFE